MKKKLSVEMTVKEFVTFNEAVFKLSCKSISLNGKKLKNNDVLVIDLAGEDKLNKETCKKKPKTNSKKKNEDRMFG